MASTGFSAAGGCACAAVRYRLVRQPMFVHCCHCLHCQRETGSAFAVNALVEADCVLVEGIEPEAVDTPTHSGKPHRIYRCPTCGVAVWSTYGDAGAAVRFLRAGTLDEPHRVPPQVHLFTVSKQPWVQVPPNLPAFEQFYDREAVWPAESLKRRRAAIAASRR